MDNKLKLVVGIDDYKRIVFSDKTFLIPHAEKISIGSGTMLSPNLEIGMPGKSVHALTIGDNCRIYAGQIAPDTFSCGDYVTIHKDVWCYGRSDVLIGHNAWFGMRCTLDAEGGFRVGNGFGAGQDTHLWSHVRHGDIIAGSEYLSFNQFVAGDDVWFVGRCTSAPANHASYSVALTESNIVKNMEYNHVYGGNPARDLTDKIGAPFNLSIDLDKKQSLFDSKITEFIGKNVLYKNEIIEMSENFDVESRTYTKTGKPLEVALMRFLLPEAKFTPR